MPYDDEDEESNESGGQLRKKLEDALKKSSELSQQLAVFQAEKLVVEKGFTTVKAEELKGVELDKLESTAAALHADRLKLQDDLLRDAFVRQGYEGDALEHQLAFATGREAGGAAAAALSNARNLGRLDSTPVPAVDVRALSPLAKIEAGLAAKKRKRAS
jgi:hypothetical protein